MDFSAQAPSFPHEREELALGAGGMWELGVQCRLEIWGTRSDSSEAKPEVSGLQGEWGTRYEG